MIVKKKEISLVVFVLFSISIVSNFPNALSLEWTNGHMKIDYPSTWKSTITSDPSFLAASFSPLSDINSVKVWFKIDNGDFADTVNSDISSLQFRHPESQFNVIVNEPGRYAVIYSYIDKVNGINMWQYRKYQQLSENQLGVESYLSPLSTHDKYWNDYATFHITYSLDSNGSSCLRDWKTFNLCTQTEAFANKMRECAAMAIINNIGSETKKYQVWDDNCHVWRYSNIP